MSNITVTKLKFNEVSALASGVDASNGAKISFSGCDDSRMVLIIENKGSAAATVTVKAGNGIQGVNDLTMTVNAGSVNALTVESGKYMAVSGEESGYVTVSGAVNVTAVLLP